MFVFLSYVFIDFFLFWASENLKWIEEYFFLYEEVIACIPDTRGL